MHPSANPLSPVTLETLHRGQLALCAMLEEILATIPMSIDRQRCLHAARMVVPLIHDAHEREEVAFDALLVRNGNAALVAAIADLKLDHCEAEQFVEDLHNALVELGRGDGTRVCGPPHRTIDGFLTSLRCHVNEERALLGALLP